MRSSYIICLIKRVAVASLILSAAPALAETAATAVTRSSGPFSAPTTTDIAQAWIQFLFYGTTMAYGIGTSSASLTPVADGLRSALGLYNLGMLAIGALLLFYHLTEMIVNTAYSGSVMGRRANKVWAPIRLVIAIGLLMPVAGGLSAGQMLVVKFAEIGSSLASNAWQTVAESSMTTLATVVAPRPPNVTPLVAAAAEMEMCHLVYQQFYAQFLGQAPHDPTMQLLGPMGDITRTAAGRLTPETWRYSNILNANTSLCGAFTFDGYRPDDYTTSGTNRLEHTAMALSGFAHTEANDILSQVTGLGSQLAPIFAASNPVPNVDARPSLVAIIDSVQQQVMETLNDSNLADTNTATDVVAQSASYGWLAAANVIPELIRLQESYGELIAHMLPSAEEPLFDHPLMAHQVLVNALAARPILPPPHPEGDMDGSLHVVSPFLLYSQISRIMSATHTWLFDTQLPKGSFAPASSLDLRDHLTDATDTGAAFGMFASAFDTQALAEGVWGIDPSLPDHGYPFASSAGSSIYNPFTALAEFGRRQYHLGTYMLGLSGSALSNPGALAPAALTALAALALLIGGLGLIFVVPFLPFFRFMIAALIWLLNLFEAVAAMPIVAIAHISPNGEGLSGSTARQAYRLWMALMVRPLLALLGLVLGFLLFTVMIGFFATAVTSFARLSSSTNGSLLLIANIALVLIFDVFAYVAVNTSFRGIFWFPDQALRWISQFTVTEGVDAPEALPIAGPPGAPATALANASVTNLIAHQSMTSGMTNITGTTTTAGPGGTTTHIHSMKAALFPSYSEKSVTPSPTVQSQAPPLSLTSPSVTVTVQGQTNSPRGSLDNQALNTKHAVKPAAADYKKIDTTPETPPEKPATLEQNKSEEKDDKKE